MSKQQENRQEITKVPLAAGAVTFYILEDETFLFEIIGDNTFKKSNLLTKFLARLINGRLYNEFIDVLSKMGQADIVNNIYLIKIVAEAYKEHNIIEKMSDMTIVKPTELPKRIV